MSMEIWIVSCVTISKIPTPERPAIFLSNRTAVEYLKEQMRMHWDVQRELFNQPLSDCPDDWRQAQMILASLHTDGSWGTYDLSSHVIELPARTRIDLGVFPALAFQ